MFTIGSHLSSAKGYLAMAREAVRIGANTFQFFTRNPRGGRAKAMDPADVAAFLDFAREHHLGPILAHASYTLNPATVDPKLQQFVRETIADDLDRLEATPGSLYNLHPGTHGGRGAEAGIQTVAETLDLVLGRAKHTTVLLETMTGSGKELGGTFEELAAIIRACPKGDSLGVCLDTCHVLAAGYDIVSDLDLVLTHFDGVIGLDRLRAVHLNDSLMPLGSRRDRHAKIGEGAIGLEAFDRIINHPALRDLPFYLETPNDPDGWGREIALLRQLYGNAVGEKTAAAKLARKGTPASAKKKTKRGGGSAGEAERRNGSEKTR